MSHWQHEIETKINTFLKEVEGQVDKNGKPRKIRMRIPRTYLYLSSTKYHCKIQFNVNKSSASRIAPFFTDHRNKNKYYEKGMVEWLGRYFENTQAKQIVKEALEAVGE